MKDTWYNSEYSFKNWLMWSFSNEVRSVKC